MVGLTKMPNASLSKAVAVAKKFSVAVDSNAGAGSNPFSDVVTYVRSLIAARLNVRKVFLGIGVAALSIASGYAGHLLIRELRGQSEEERRDQSLEMNFELNKARDEANANKKPDPPPDGVIILHQVRPTLHNVVANC